MKRRTAWVFGLAMFVVVSASHALAQGTGRSLDIQPGARENGMGAAGVALLGDGSEAVWWNPAALGFARKPSVQLSYAQLLPGLARDIHHWNGAAAVPLGTTVGVGAGYTYLDFGSDFGSGSGGAHPNEKSGCISAGVAVMPGLAFGATVKRIRIQLSPFSTVVGTGYGFDLGGLYRHAIDSLTFSAGANVQNLGPEVTFGDASGSGPKAPLSRNLKLGGAIQYHALLSGGSDVGATAVLDFNQSLLSHSRDFRTWNGGVELYAGLPRILRVSVRGGYYYDHEGQIEDPTFGGGVRWFGLTADVGLIPQARDSGLKNVKKYTFGYHFDPFPAH